MALYLKVYEQDQLIKTQLIESERLEIGRAEGAEIHFNSPEISRNHARLILKPHALDDEDMNEGIADLIDAGSRYGVWVHNEQVWYHALSTEEFFRISENLFLCLSRQADLLSLVTHDKMQDDEGQRNNASYIQSLERDTAQFSVVNEDELVQAMEAQSVNNVELPAEPEVQVEESIISVEKSVQPILQTKREPSFEAEAGQTIEAELDLIVEVESAPEGEPVAESEAEPKAEFVVEVEAKPVVEMEAELEVNKIENFSHIQHV